MVSVARFHLAYALVVTRDGDSPSTGSGWFNYGCSHLFRQRQRSPDGAPCATYGATPCSTLSFFFDNNFKPASPLGDHIVDKAEEDDDKVDCDKVSAG